MNFSLGLIEVSSLGNAIRMLDDMLKVADVEFVATERRLGGRLVTIVVKGELTSVRASVDVGVETAKRLECFKAANIIARPHEEILKFLHLDAAHEKPVNSESAATHVGEVNLPDHPEAERKAEEDIIKEELKAEAENKKTAAPAQAAKTAPKKPSTRRTRKAKPETESN